MSSGYARFLPRTVADSLMPIKSAGLTWITQDPFPSVIESAK